MAEIPVATAHASVLLCDLQSACWKASGGIQGLSKVQLFRHQQKNTYRVVGWKLDDKSVVLNCSVRGDLRYVQMTTTFHQWRDLDVVYGLNFTSIDEAQAFSRSVLAAVASISGPPLCPPPPPPIQSVIQPRPPSPDYALPCKLTSNQIPSGAQSTSDYSSYQATGSICSESSIDNRYQSSSDDSVQGHRRQPSSASSGYASSQYTGIPSQMAISGNLPDVTAHVTDPAFYQQPPSRSMIPPAPYQSAIPLAPPLPGAGQTHGAFPSQSPACVIPQPPPLPSATASRQQADDDDTDSDQAGSFAALLRAGRSKIKSANNAPATSQAQPSTATNLVAQDRPVSKSNQPVANQKPADAVPSGDMFSEMKRVLEAKRRQREAKESEGVTVPAPDKLVPSKSILRKSESPEVFPLRKTSTTSTPKEVTGSTGFSRQQLNMFKEEILSDFRRELALMKSDIINAIRNSEA